MTKIVEAGPTSEGLEHMARWRCADLKTLIHERWGVEYHVRTIGKLLHLTERQISQLRDLASLVVDQMELRLSARRAIAQRDTLLSEVNHWVANSLALVASMAHLQSNTVSERTARAALEEMQTRITAIANVHRQLYTPGDVGVVAFGGYLEGWPVG